MNWQPNGEGIFTREGDLMLDIFWDNPLPENNYLRLFIYNAPTLQLPRNWGI